MCTCASCEYTDRFGGLPDLLCSPVRMDHKHGWDNWPRGDPAGPRSSASAYAEHKRMCPPIAKPYKAPIFGAPRYSDYGLNGPITPAPKWLHDWINRDWPRPAEAGAVSPATPCKAPQHFPAQDRQRETAVIYAMPKAKHAKKSVGRPPLPGRRVVIKLEEKQIKRAMKLGGGNVAAGIRAALTELPRRSSG